MEREIRCWKKLAREREHFISCVSYHLADFHLSKRADPGGNNKNNKNTRENTKECLEVVYRLLVSYGATVKQI